MHNIFKILWGIMSSRIQYLGVLHIASWSSRGMCLVLAFCWNAKPQQRRCCLCLQLLCLLLQWILEVFCSLKCKTAHIAWLLCRGRRRYHLACFSSLIHCCVFFSILFWRNWITDAAAAASRPWNDLAPFGWLTNQIQHRSAGSH